MGDEIEEARESGRERGRRKEERRVMRKGVGKLGGKRKKGYSKEEGKEDGGRIRRSKDIGKEKGSCSPIVSSDKPIDQNPSSSSLISSPFSCLPS